MTQKQMAYLLDTNVISEFAKPQPNPNVLRWMQNHQDSPLYLSGVTIGELEKGITKLPRSNKKERLTGWLNDKLLVQYKGFILVADIETFRLWGRISAKAESMGEKMQVVDALIAAFAKQHQLILVTRNVADFLPSGIDLLNPWEG